MHGRERVPAILNADYPLPCEMKKGGSPEDTGASRPGAH